MIIPTILEGCVLFMYFPFLTLFIIFIIILRIKIKLSDKEEALKTERFWNRETQANQVRKQDVSLLPYIHVPIDEFELPEIDDQKFEELKSTLYQLSTQKIVNLSQYTNTDLKLKYGAANLSTLSEYDSNYTELLRTLNKLGHLLYQENYVKEAQKILEYGISCGTDIRSHYILLANIYHDTCQSEKINTLIQEANKINSLLKDSILAYLKNSTII